MYNELSPETVSALHALAQAAGGVGPIHIARTRICDHCKNEAEEAFPYCVTDCNGNYWNHLCNGCFDILGCSYPTEEEPKERIVHGNLETVVVTHYSYGWESDMPVTLIRYRDGSADLHCQTGDHHDRAIADALDALADRYITIDQESDRVYSTGVYYKVTGGLLP